MVVLPSGIRPDLTPEDSEMKLDIPGSSEVSLSSSSSSRSPPLPAMETFPGGPLVVKPTQGELWARVELLAKKKRKHKARDPSEGGSPARGKVSKLGVSNSRSCTSVQGRGQAWFS